MTYFIDFDHTIFDTTAFKKMLGEEFSLKNIPSDIHEIFSKKEEEKVEEVVAHHGLIHTFATFVATGRVSFAPNELKKYLYPDVTPFFERHASETVIVTYGVQAFITAKVTNALANFPVQRIVYTLKKKGHVMRKLCTDIQGQRAFIDDAVFQLESVAKRCPQVQIYEMRRDGGAGDGRWPVLHTLDSLA